MFQSERGKRHAEIVQRLLDEGRAYLVHGRARTKESRRGMRSTGNRGFRGEDEGGGLRCACASPTTARPSSGDVIRGEELRSRPRSRTIS